MIETLAKRAIDILKSKCELPKTGFLAGGSIANIVWELHSGKKAVLNDIDIFVLEEKTDIIPEKNESLYSHEENVDHYFENGYSHLIKVSKLNQFYTIISSENDGLINIVKYKSSTDDPMFVIKSFDLNCTQIGYSIEQNKFYWTKDFEDFINTGKIKVSCANTPAHTAIRLVKKCHELGVEFDPFEIEILSYCMTGSMKCYKLRFKKRYYEIFNKYGDLLNKFFNISRDTVLEEYLKCEKNIDTEIYYLENTGYFKDLSEVCYKTCNINRTDDFMFFVRKIYGNEKMMNFWNKLYYFFSNESYIDGDVSDDDLELLWKISKIMPNSIEKLKGMTITEQIGLVKKLMNVYKDNPIVAICLLENKKIDKDIEIDEDLKLLLELSVRKEIVKNKVNISMFI